MGKKTRIEWSDSTWNPVTGCLHGCPYCYARGISHRFGGASETHHNETVGSECQWETEETGELHDLDDAFFDPDRGKNSPYPYYFDPTFHRYRLWELARTKTPKTIFVGSMTDLFGAWVPMKWIIEVLDACLASPQHRYLFLTKNPARYLELEQMALLPRLDNFWYGSTVTTSNDEAMWCTKMDCHWFISAEPLLSGIDLMSGDIGHMPEWVIIGAESGNRKGKVTPERGWVEKLVSDCYNFNIPVFMKDSIKPAWGETLITEFPWEVE